MKNKIGTLSTLFYRFQRSGGPGGSRCSQRALTFESATFAEGETSMVVSFSSKYFSQVGNRMSLVVGSLQRETVASVVSEEVSL